MVVISRSLQTVSKFGGQVLREDQAGEYTANHPKAPEVTPSMARPADDNPTVVAPKYRPISVTAPSLQSVLLPGENETESRAQAALAGLVLIVRGDVPEHKGTP